MRSDWREITLGEFVRLQRGHDLTEEQRSPGNIPVMGSAGQNGHHNQSKASGPGVVIGRSGASMGKVHYSASDYWPHNTCLYVTDFLGNNPKFVYYFLKTIDLAGFNSGSAQPSLNRNFIYNLKIRVPYRYEQDSIESLLSSLDDRIALLRETNATLEAIAQALFKSWFIDFDPVKAKAEDREPEGMDADTAALFPSEFEDSELGAIPKGWKATLLKQIASLSSGKRPSKRYDMCCPEASVPLYGGAGIMGYVEEALVEKSVIVTGRVGTLGKIMRVFVPFWPSDNTLLITPSSVEIFYFIYFSMLRMDLASLNRGSTQPLLTQTDLGKQLSILPTAEILKKFHSTVSLLFNSIDSNSNLIFTLAELRDTLLPKLMSGQLRLPEAEALVESTVGKAA